MDPIIETTSLLTLNPRNKPTEARDAIAVDRIVLRNDLRLYIREAWHVVEPSTVYLENWHIDLIAEYLEAVTAGQIKRLYEVIIHCVYTITWSEIEVRAIAAKLKALEPFGRV
jgi:hypothetical protein